MFLFVTKFPQNIPCFETIVTVWEKHPFKFNHFFWGMALDPGRSDYPSFRWVQDVLPSGDFLYEKSSSSRFPMASSQQVPGNNVKYEWSIPLARWFVTSRVWEHALAVLAAIQGYRPPTPSVWWCSKGCKTTWPLYPHLCPWWWRCLLS